jgi:hypothetical protein
VTLDLDAIRARYDRARETGNLGDIDDSMADVPALLAEVEALRAELTERIRRLASHRGVIERQRARAERRDPTGLTVPCDGSCGSDDPHDAHLAPGALDRLSAERTEPATGEVVDPVARLTDIEGEILAELGIPLKTIVEFGREWERRCLPALRAELDAARAADKARRMGPVELGVPARAEQGEALENPPTSDNDENTRLNDAVVFLKSVAGDAQGASDEWFAVQVRRMRDLFGFSPAARAERTEPATGEDVARMFHEAYERLAPEYGYRTREASAKPWDEVPEQNRALMVATVTEVLAALALHLSPECQHTNACNGCDGTVVCKGRCWCGCHNEEATLPPASNELREHPGTGQPMEGVEFPADGTEHELTEPATGEDRTELYRIAAQRIDSYLDPNEPDGLLHSAEWIAGDVVDAILAALDLPGRERADSDTSDRFTWGGVQSD